MRKYLIIGSFIVITLCVLTQYGGISHAGPTGVAGSNHDLSIFYDNLAFTGNDTGGPFRYETDQVCIFCHTPHGGSAQVREDTYWTGSGFTNTDTGTQSPVMLWNRSFDQNAGLANATTGILVYNSASMDAYSGGAASTYGQVWAYSLMCLSCHDGVQALNVLHKYPSDHTSGPITLDGADQRPQSMGSVENLPANIGERENAATDTVTHLENDHPVSIDYDLAHAGGGLRDGDYNTGTVSYNGETVRLFQLPGASTGTKQAVECSSCHDVHNEGSNSATAPVSVRYKYPFLAVKSEGSTLCLVCHDK